jgi:hypothetical protein
MHRDLSPDEQTAVDKKSKRWFGDVVQGAGTPLPNTLASPTKGGILQGRLGGRR